MSDDPNLERHDEVHSEPHGGHGGTTYEGTDASVRMVIMSLAIIALTLVITAGITFPIQNILKHANPPGQLPSPLAPERVIPAGPLLQVHPWETLPDLRAHENEVLNSYGKNPNGKIHIPIDRAIDATAAKLNIRPNAPQGLTIPGGQGRDFAGSLGSMPPAYQPPTIQGEIRKNAQK